MLPDLAEGKPAPVAAEHVRACRDCAKKLDQFKVMLSAAATPIQNAPRDVIERAKGIVGGRARVSIARLVGSSLTLAHARSTSSDFQLVVGTERHKVRLMYSRVVGGKWEITGRAPGSDWTVKGEGVERACNSEGGFIIQAKKLESTQFSLLHKDEEILVPSAEELLHGDPG